MTSKFSEFVQSKRVQYCHKFKKTGYFLKVASVFAIDGVMDIHMINYLPIQVLVQGFEKMDK